MTNKKNLSELQALLAERGINQDRTSDGYQNYIESKEPTTKVGLMGKTLVVEGSMHLALGRTRSVKDFKI